jgi:hypothetical protein
MEGTSMASRSVAKMAATVFLGLALACVPQARAADTPPLRYGSWLAGWDTTPQTGPYAYAVTINESRQALGITCTLDGIQCEWRLILQIPCRDGLDYIVLTNAPHGSRALRVRCLAQKGENGENFVWRFTNAAEAMDIIVGSQSAAPVGIIGFALPLESGQFVIVRFPYDGMIGALSDVNARMAKPSSKMPNGTGGTKDQLL